MENKLDKPIDSEIEVLLSEGLSPTELISFKSGLDDLNQISAPLGLKTKLARLPETAANSSYAFSWVFPAAKFLVPSLALVFILVVLPSKKMSTLPEKAALAPVETPKSDDSESAILGDSFDPQTFDIFDDDLDLLEKSI